MYRLIFVSSFVLVLLCPPVLSQTQTHPFSVQDLLALEKISDIQVSPDGQQVVFVRTVTDLDENRTRTDLWMVGIDGAGLRRLTSHPENDSNPQWTPDGKSILFISSRSKPAQVWRIAVDGGEAAQVTDLPLDAGNLNRVARRQAHRLHHAGLSLPHGRTDKGAARRP